MKPKNDYSLPIKTLTPLRLRNRRLLQRPREGSPEPDLFGAIPDTYNYAHAFQEAAIKLADGIVVGDVSSVPLVFLLRHAIELKIKAILLEFGHSIPVAPEKVINRRHQLGKQLEDLNILVTQLGSTISPALRAVVQAWDTDDPTGMKSRFATDLLGQMEVLKNIEEFDVGQFVKESLGVLDEVESHYQAAIRRELDQACEDAQEEYRSEAEHCGTDFGES